MATQALRSMHVLIHPRSAISLPAVTAAALAVVLPWLLAEPWSLEYGVAVALAFAGWAAVTDAETGLIPDRLVLLAVVPSALVLGREVAVGGGASAAQGAAIGLLAFAGPLLVVHIASPGAMGFGDVKLAAALGAAIGLVDPRSAVLGLCIASAVALTTGVARRRSTVPFGPGLVLGATLSVVVFGSDVGGSLPWR